PNSTLFPYTTLFRSSDSSVGLACSRISLNFRNSAIAMISGVNSSPSTVTSPFVVPMTFETHAKIFARIAMNFSVHGMSLSSPVMNPANRSGFSEITFAISISASAMPWKMPGSAGPIASMSLVNASDSGPIAGPSRLNASPSIVVNRDTAGAICLDALARCGARESNTDRAVRRIVCHVLTKGLEISFVVFTTCLPRDSMCFCTPLLDLAARSPIAANAPPNASTSSVAAAPPIAGSSEIAAAIAITMPGGPVPLNPPANAAPISSPAGPPSFTNRPRASCRRPLASRVKPSPNPRPASSPNVVNRGPIRSTRSPNRSNSASARRVPRRTPSSSTPSRTSRFEMIATRDPLPAVGAAHGAVQRLDGGELLLPRHGGLAVPGGDEVGRDGAAALAAVGVGDGGRDDPGLQVGAGGADGPGDTLIGDPRRQLAGGDPRQHLRDGHAQGER